jgi:putative spermidine/putrescine transport system substrate-binding protein
MRKWVTVLTGLMMFGIRGSAQAADVICYNCPPQWADFASMLKAVKADLGYDIPFDNKNSGQALSQIIAEKTILLPTLFITESTSA